jgi:cell division protein FtsW
MARANVYILIFAVSLLAALGVVMLASTSYFLDEGNGVAYLKLRSQCMWLIISSLAACFMALIKYQMLYTYRWWIYGAAVLGLGLCYLPFFAEEVNGASRWLSLHSFGFSRLHFQPSELGKLACVIVLAGWYVRYESMTRNFVGGFVLPGTLVLVIVLLIAGEVDLGNAALVGTVGVALMFVAGACWRYLLPIVILGPVGLGCIIKIMPNRVERIMAFLDLEKYKDGLGMQQWRSLIAFGSGGVEGLGLGNGRQKMLYLPEAHTDFIFPMVGEELGFYGTGLVLLTFAVLIYAGMSISRYAPDRFGRFLAFGITLTFALETLINMGVTTALLPNKGLPLPFVSYGGSSLLFAMMGAGILINIHRQSSHQSKKDLLAIPRRRMTAGSHGAF